ncbi:MAG: hypothetical protein ABR514_05380 [Chthoniobacterales bacterium]
MNVAALRQRPITAALASYLRLLPGCSVLVVSPYDELTDRSANELITRTEAFLARYAASTDESGRATTSGRPYDDQAAAFYNEARASVAAMLLRSGQKAKDEEEIQILRDLSRQSDRGKSARRRTGSERERESGGAGCNQRRAECSASGHQRRGQGADLLMTATQEAVPC